MKYMEYNKKSSIIIIFFLLIVVVPVYLSYLYNKAKKVSGEYYIPPTIENPSSYGTTTYVGGRIIEDKTLTQYKKDYCNLHLNTLSKVEYIYCRELIK